MSSKDTVDNDDDDDVQRKAFAQTLQVALVSICFIISYSINYFFFKVLVGIYKNCLKKSKTTISMFWLG